MVLAVARPGLQAQTSTESPNCRVFRTGSEPEVLALKDVGLLFGLQVHIFLWPEPIDSKVHAALHSFTQVLCQAAATAASARKTATAATTGNSTALHYLLATLTCTPCHVGNTVSRRKIHVSSFSLSSVVGDLVLASDLEVVFKVEGRGEGL